MSSIFEKGREVWGKVSGSLESAMDQAQSEVGKLQTQAAGAPDASKARIWAKIGETQAKQEADQEKLRSSLLDQIAEANTQLSQLEGAAAGVSGSAREKLTRDIDQVREERDKALTKLTTNLESEIAAAENEMATLQKEAADASGGAAARIQVRAEWARIRRDTVQQWLQEVRTLQPVAAPVSSVPPIR